MKYLFYFQGIATRLDKTRNIEPGDLDVQALICDEEVDPRSRCNLSEPVFLGKFKLNKDWN